VSERVKEIRNEYLIHLHRGNAALKALGQRERDIENLESTLVYYAVSRQAGFANSRPSSKDTSVAHHLDLEEGGHDENFGVLASMGLLSRSRNQSDEGETSLCVLLSFLARAHARVCVCVCVRARA
jgi:hypothetical protein